MEDNERYLPIANVSRIMKNAVPPNVKISKEAKEFVQNCVTEFIIFITSEGIPFMKLRKNVKKTTEKRSMGKIFYTRLIS